METEKGSLSVQTENIFPVIKRWLYSDKDIFIREAVSNAADAITKLKRLVSLAQAEVEDDAYRIDVTLNRDAKTITIADNGIGMTREEVDRYINQIALSARWFHQQVRKRGRRVQGGHHRPFRTRLLLGLYGQRPRGNEDALLHRRGRGCLELRRKRPL